MSAVSRRTEGQSPKRAAVEAGVLEATERLLSDGGSFAELSVDRIAKQAGLSRTAFYFYFRDKRELLMRLTEEVTDQLYGHAAAWWGAEDDGVQRLADALGAIVSLYREHAVLLRAVVETSAYDEQVAAFWRAVIGRFVDATRGRIEAEQRAGRATQLDASATAFALAWMTERTIYEHLVQHGPAAKDDDSLVEALTGIWMRSVYG